MPFDDRSPIYRQIADQIRDDIVSGACRDGDQVLSTNGYALEHRINPATAAKAFQELVDEGILEKRRGIGMFVVDGASERLRSERRARFADDVLAPVLAEARRLGFTVDDVVTAITSLPPASPPSTARTPATRPSTSTATPARGGTRASID